MNLADYLHSRLREQRRAKERFGWKAVLNISWYWPSFRHGRIPYDQERER